MLLQLPSLWDFPQSHWALLQAWAQAEVFLSLVPMVFFGLVFFCVFLRMARASISHGKKIFGAFSGSFHPPLYPFAVMLL